MKRKDGRELVTEYPVTAMDMIDYDPNPPKLGDHGVLACQFREDRYEAWMDDI